MSTPSPLPLSRKMSASTFWAGLHLKRQIAHRRFWMWALGLAIALAVLKVATPITPQALASLCLFLMLPMIALFFGVGVLRADIDDSTLTYPFTRPVGRVGIFAARFVGALALVWLLAIPMAVVCASGAPGAMGPFLLTALLGGLAYTAMFSLLGLWMKWSTWVGLGWILLWEQGVSLVPGFLGRLALITHLRAVAELPVGGNSPLAMLWEAPPQGLSYTVLLLVPALTLWLSVRRVQRKAFVIAR